MSGTKNYIAYVEAFNRQIKTLTLDVETRIPNDPQIARVKKRVMSIISIDPLYIIKEVGPYLYSYREQLYNLTEENFKFFLDNDFKQEFEESEDEEKTEMVSYLMPKVKECMRDLEQAEKESYGEIIVDLLDSYVEYLAVTQGV